MQHKTNIIPLGGMNTDSDPRHFEKGDYLAAYNILVGSPQEQGSEGLVQNIKSTVAKALEVYSGTRWEFLDVVIENETNTAYVMVLFLQEAPSYFFIYKHDIKTDIVTKVYQELASLWNISDTTTERGQVRFYNSAIIDGNLIWTDNVNDIRMVNIDRLYNSYINSVDQAIFWNSSDAYSGDYDVGDFVYYLDKLYSVIQITTGQSAAPSTLALYYTELGDVVDFYLNTENPDVFTLAALPPLIALTVVYGSNGNLKINQLQGQLWQFSYQYVYMDYRKSTFAPPSAVLNPGQEEDLEGHTLTDITKNNFLYVRYNTGGADVRRVRIVGRSSDDPAAWFLIEEIELVNSKGERVIAFNKATSTRFYNDSALQSITASEVYTLFSYVPIRAKHMEVVEGNRLVFGNVVEGYDKINTSVEIEIAWTDLGAINFKSVVLSVTEDSRLIAGTEDTEWVLTFGLPSADPGTCVFILDVWEKQFTYAYTSGEVYPTSVKTGIQALLTAEFTSFYGAMETITASVVPGSVTHYLNTFGVIVRRNGPSPYGDAFPSFGYQQPGEVAVGKYAVLKSGVTQSWAIIYRDLVGRTAPPSGAAEMTKYIPFATEDAISNTYSKPSITFNINHTPPEWAESYEIVYGGNKSQSWHLQLLGANFSKGKLDHDLATRVDNESDNYYRIRIAKIQSLTRNTLHNWIVEQYVWQDGDRIRVIGKVTTAGNLTELNEVIYDVQVLGVYTDTDIYTNIGDSEPVPEGSDPATDEILDEWIYFSVSDEQDLAPSDTGPAILALEDNLLVEIYRPLAVDSSLFFTTGMTFPIEDNANPLYGRVHGGDTPQVLNSDGTSFSPAIVDNTSFDSWKFLRQFRNIQDEITMSQWVEHQYPSDYYITQLMSSQGSPIPDIDLQQEVLTKRLRHGGAISIGSQLNYLADFLYDDLKDVKDIDGPIEGCRLVGFVLKVIQKTKITSIYISRQESFSANGDPQYLFTDDIFGSARPGMEHFGTAHPGSVLVHNRHLYFWDQKEGAVIRDAANGVIEVSDASMKKFFNDLATTMDAIANPLEQFVEFTFSKELNRLFCAFGDASSQQIVTFSEDNQRWKEIMEVQMFGGMFYWIGKRLWHLYNEYIYEWFKGTTFQSIGGVPRDGKLSMIASPDPNKPMIYNAIIAYQNGAVPEFEQILVPAKATASGEAQQTFIYPVNIKKREGVYYCGILNDINTPGVGDQNHMLMNGNQMRGLYAQIDMLFTDTVNSITLTNVIVVSTPSERSK